MGRGIRPGDVLADRFEIESEAGSGGMGTVFRARDRLEGVPVAVKVLNERSEAFIQRFRREAAVLAELDHPAIVAYVDHGVGAEGDHYLVLEWLDGLPLHQRLRRGPLAIHDVVTLGRRAAAALGAAHRRRILHRDVKLSNLFLPGDDPAQLRVLDFGIARDIRRTVELTATGALIGTLAYMAPEQASGDKGLDARVDVYSLGVVLYECLTGKRAFSSEDTTAGLARILLEPPPRVRDVRPVPAALDELIFRMMAKDRDGRPADGGAVVRELDVLELAETRVDGDLATRTTALTTDERRIVWMLFIGRLADAAPTAQPDGTTGVRELVAALRREVDAREGRLDVLVDGTAVAVFDSRGSGTDRLEHAARCALDLRGLYGQLTLALSVGTTVGERLEIRDAVERGAAALAHAEPGAVRLEVGAEGLLSRSFHVDRDRRGAILRGRLDGRRAARAVMGRRTPFVGRYKELASLEAIFAECVAEPVTVAAVVDAAPGVGKSRLCEELLGRLAAAPEPPLVLHGRADSISAGSPFGMLAHAVRAAAGVVDGEDEETARERMAAFVGDTLGGEGDDVRRVTAFVGELARVYFAEGYHEHLAAARRDSRLMADGIRSAWLTLVERTCTRRPLLVVLDDVHWGDRPTVDLVEASLRSARERPLMALALGRPELDDRFPNLWAERHPQRISLGPLSPRAGEKLVRSVMGDDSEGSLVASIVERSGGNPLFAEELVRAMVQGASDDLPESLLAVVQVRLDDLDRDTRRVLRAASVYGQRFWEAGVEALLAGDEAAAAEAHLDVLVHHELVERRQPSSLSGESEYAFRHALVRDAAYEMLTEDDRCAGHAAAGRWLEEAGESNPVVLAEHYARGDVPDRAREWFLRGALAALEGDDPAEAVRRAERGLALCASGEMRGELLLAQVDGQSWSGEYDRAASAGAEAVERLPEGSARYFHALGETCEALARLGRYDDVLLCVPLLRVEPRADAEDARIVAMSRAGGYVHQSGRVDEGAALIDGAAELLSARPDASGHARGYWHAADAMRSFYTGNLSGYLSSSTEAMRCFEASGDPRRACRQRINVGIAYAQLGDYAAARPELEATLGVAERMGLRWNAAVSAQILCAVLIEEDLDSAEAAADHAVELGRALASSTNEGAALAMRAETHLRSGRVDEAAADADRALELLEPIPVRRADALALRSRTSLAGGEVERAVSLAREALAVAERVGSLGPVELPIRLALAEALDASGARDEAERVVAEAIRVIGSEAARIVEPRWRRSFTEQVHVHARLFQLARTWGLTGA